MSSSILHQCPFCGHVSDISLALAAFVENPHCSKCGLSAAESNLKMQNELADLFSKQMSLSQFGSEQSTGPSVSQTPPISYSVTQHYHHSSHIASQHKAGAADIDVLLKQNGLQPQSLSTSQLDLVRHASPEQQERLIQTWKLYSQFEQQQAIAGLNPSSTQDLEMYDSMDDSKQYAEPYMISGYEMHASETGSRHLPTEPTTGQPYSPSRDPVYQSQEWRRSGFEGSGFA
ncbi:hypothetical protein N7474_003881 [Penicillium riverlandense]|uniref:uncharacterized protein n=1 Tax=Penicillium riverlandense TaxID=1903569 RepID=UPI002549ADE6|nr:uncharacterized protein N7474_003881 [Penicillium riverlandense]KAJ5818290.1 hypothetical protein N7474_003881 [Penicillium riverlandense]